jgi:hypothetical protein
VEGSGAGTLGVCWPFRIVPVKNVVFPSDTDSELGTKSVNEPVSAALVNDKNCEEGLKLSSTAAPLELVTLPTKMAAKEEVGPPVIMEGWVNVTSSEKLPL